MQAVKSYCDLDVHSSSGGYIPEITVSDDITENSVLGMKFAAIRCYSCRM